MEHMLKISQNWRSSRTVDTLASAGYYSQAKNWQPSRLGNTLDSAGSTIHSLVFRSCKIHIKFIRSPKFANELSLKS